MCRTLYIILMHETEFYDDNDDDGSLKHGISVAYIETIMAILA